MVSYSPVTEKHLNKGMTVAKLCVAALQYSDNSAANQLIKLLGGPTAVMEFARSIGDTTFRRDKVRVITVEKATKLEAPSIQMKRDHLETAHKICQPVGRLCIFHRERYFCISGSSYCTSRNGRAQIA